MTTLATKVLGIDFENPFILSSAPPTAKIENYYNNNADSKDDKTVR